MKTVNAHQLPFILDEHRNPDDIVTVRISEGVMFIRDEDGVEFGFEASEKQISWYEGLPENKPNRVLVLCTFARVDVFNSFDDITFSQRLFSVVPPVKVEMFQEREFIIDHTGWDFDPYYVALAAIFKLDTDVFQHDMEVIEL